jgi:hypothetical protein
MSEIDSVMMHYKDNYVSYSDTDPMTDYFNGYSLNQRETAKWIKEDGADIITGSYSNPAEVKTLEKRLYKIAKIAGYDVELNYEGRHMKNGNIDQQWMHYGFKLIRQGFSKAHIRSIDSVQGTA